MIKGVVNPDKKGEHTTWGYKVQFTRFYLELVVQARLSSTQMDLKNSEGFGSVIVTLRFTLFHIKSA